jgi:hypothetical protein
MTPVEWLAGAQLVRALILVSTGDGAAVERDVRALSEEKVVLHAALEVRGPRGCAWITNAPAISGTRCTLVQAPPEATVEWSKIEADEAAYDNVPGGVFSLSSIGWLESSWTTGWSVPADIRPIMRRGIFLNAGTMRYRVAIEVSGRGLWTSPGLNEERGGPPASRDVRKLSLRTGDDYLGVMTELANLPYIFGSTEVGRELHQAERAIGVDCADLVIYGLRRTGHDLSYRSSRTLGPVSRRVAGAVRAGDWIIFSGHVGVLYEDRGVLGKIDAPDLMMHIAWKELAIEAMSDSAYGSQPFEVRRYDETLTSRQKPIQ